MTGDFLHVDSKLEEVPRMINKEVLAQFIYKLT